MISKFYHGGRYGQVHLRRNGHGGDGPPLVCLHATAYSSRSFVPLLTALDGGRHAIAPDTPGYGESDPPPGPTDIAGYAEALVEALPDRFDILGYHSGVSLAVEMAISRPARVGQLILMGVPYFRAIDFAAWRAKLTTRHVLGDALTQFDERWDYLVANRPVGLSLERGFQNFVDELKAWPNGWWLHEALFDHDLDARLPMVRQPVTVLVPQGHLAEPSRRAAALLRDVRVIELPELNGAVLDLHTDRIAAELLMTVPVRTSAAE